ncbi:MAG: phosphoesterase, partial [Sulfurimonas sp.]
MVELNQINESKHIVLIADNETFSLANALYSYVLSLHKKVSLVMNENIDKKFAFLPWFDKVRKEIPSSSDLEIKVTLDTLDLFEAFY